MRCRNCDYRLWNLRSRKCPECGTPFLPSEFEFALNSVQFCCPHCNQAYYETDDRGHLDPIEFDCVSCGTCVHMDEMVLLPSVGVEEEETQVEQMPWLDRRERGALRSWLSCVGMALVAPGRLMRLTPAESSIATAWWFAIFTHLLILLATALPVILFAFVMAGPVGMSMGLGLGGVGCVGSLGVVVVIALEGLAVHGLLRLTGKMAGSLGRTYQALCYSSGANVACAIPCIGWYFGWIWWLVSAVVMVKEAHQVRTARAAFATLTFPVLALVSGVVLYIWFVVSAMSGAFAGMGSLGVPAVSDTQVVLDSVLNYAEQHSGRGPDHAIELVEAGTLASFELVPFPSATTEANVPVGNTTLDQFDFFSGAQADQEIQAAIDALPNETVAHRLGDFVFTYHGIDFSNVEDRLWVVIHWPDPEVNTYMAMSGAAQGQTTGTGGVQTTPFPIRLISIGMADGSVVQHPTSSMNRFLTVQNTVRAKQGLAPLPHPATVTHSKPGVAPPED